MKVEYSKKCVHELALIPSTTRISIEKFIFETLPQLEYLHESNKIESMKGYKNYFKVRFGDYRVGPKKENDIIIVVRVLHRKEIYKYFP